MKDGLDWAAHGLWNLSAWQLVLFTLVMTHVTMISVTIFCTATRRTGRWTCTLWPPISFAFGCGSPPAR